MNKSVFRFWMSVGVLVGACAALAPAAHAVDASCQLKYPVVLSHHWSMGKICPDTAPSTGDASCVVTQNYDKYCAIKGTDASGRKTCLHWQVTAEEEALPPRNVNVHDASLKRSLSQYHRYFSLDIVKRLRDVCGNKVYLADKPAYASYEVRARSLRNTVQQALAQEGADKVILVGFSQGVQDARYMAALLPVDDADPSRGLMKQQVAAIVSLAGEDGGAESSQLALDLAFTITGGNWANSQQAMGIKDSDFMQGFWRRDGDAPDTSVMVEGCQGPRECQMTPDDRLRSALHSIYHLSSRFMRPPLIQLGLSSPGNWQTLRDFVRARSASWPELIPAQAEANNGVRYLSYVAQIRKWHGSWGDALSRDALMHNTIFASDGDNDGLVSVWRQQFANKAANFEHVKTMSGKLTGRGYHHMFFSGRNDAQFVPAASVREAAPYEGDSADFYQQMARDLKARGF